MAVSMTLYNHTAKLFANKEVTLTTLKLMLLGAAATFDATHTTISAASGSNQVSGNGWTSGGITLANVNVATVTTNDARLDADDISVTATGGAIGPASFAVLYDSTSNKPLAFIDFGGAKEAGEGTDFKVIIDASGLIKWTVA